jgi:hypothetical protein
VANVAHSSPEDEADDGVPGRCRTRSRPSATPALLTSVLRVRLLLLLLPLVLPLVLSTASVKRRQRRSAASKSSSAWILACFPRRDMLQDAQMLQLHTTRSRDASREYGWC